VGKIDDQLLLEHMSKQLKEHKHFASRDVRFLFVMKNVIQIE
jgi:hypothetical protein